MNTFDSYWDATPELREILRDGQRVLQQLWVQKYLMPIDGKEIWGNSSNYIWADVPVNVNDPSYWENKELDNGN